jgi:hypothetical protein
LGASCVYRDGDGVGGHEEYLGQAQSEPACAHLVMNIAPSANGATFGAHDRACYAEFDMSGVSASSLYRSCLFADVASPCSGLFAGEGGGLCEASVADALHSSIDLSAAEVARTCAVHAVTRGSTCHDFCQGRGRRCAWAQDNRGSSCDLDGNHARQRTDENGCNQVWGNQICGCTGCVHQI